MRNSLPRPGDDREAGDLGRPGESVSLHTARRQIVSNGRGSRSTASIADDRDRAAAAAQLVRRFLSDRGAGTLAAYARDLDEFAGFRRRSRTEAITDLLRHSHTGAARVALAYAVHLRRQGRAGKTISRRLGTLRSVVGRAHDAGLVDWLLELPSDDSISKAMAIEPQREEAPYLFPRHEMEIDRLDIQHYALREALKSNYAAPVRKPARLIDVGCGSGQWAYDLCQELPGSLVVGFDLAPSKRGWPGNYAFVQGNLLHGLPFRDDQFDFVHQRLLAASGVPLRAWPAVVADLTRVTRPDGWLELVEAPPELGSSGPATERLFGLVRQLGRSLGLDTTSIIVRSLGSHLERAGLVEVQSRTVDLPVGEWGGRVGSLLASGVRAGMMRLVDTFNEKLGVPEAESGELIRTMTQEFDQHRTQSHFTIAFGRKPRLAVPTEAAG
jgi:SAM-dependent methyltransferase